jgi:hypothetical protein
MAIDFDTTHAPRRPSELVALVEAVVAADPGDESDWLEWKSTLDLGRAEGRFAVARAVLGLSNRRPDHARRVCEGHGYVVIGAEPGEVQGVQDVDPAVLDDGLSPYLGGSQGPRWAATYVAVAGKKVLVATVDAPRDGDPIFCLRKTYLDAREGTVYVRRLGKTVPASAADMDYLSERLRRGSSVAPLALELEAVGRSPLRWFDAGDVDAAIDEWLARETEVQLTDAAEIDRQRRAPKHINIDELENRSGLLGASQQMADLQRSIAHSVAFSLGGKDTRTLEEYEEQVGSWAEAVRSVAFEVLASRYLADNAVKFVIANPVERHLADVHVKVHIPGEVRGLDEAPDGADFPTPPRRFGEPKQVEGFLPRLGDLSPSVGIPTVPPRQWIEDGSVNFRWDVGHLRPLESDESDEIFLFLPDLPNGGEIVATWEATSPTVDGVVRGSFVLAVDPAPVTARSLLHRDEW